MKVIKSGWVGTKVQCPDCECISEIEKETEVSKIKDGDASNTVWAVHCPECKCHFPIQKKDWVPPPPNGLKRGKGKIEKLNRVEIPNRGAG